MTATPLDQDRVTGVLLGAACGDALGVPYEFARALGPSQIPQMIGGGLGPYEPGEYSDDTQMHVCVAHIAASGMDLRTDAAQDALAKQFLHWAAGGATDIGGQTRRVMAEARRNGGDGEAMRAAAQRTMAHEGANAGNGSLMRTGAVALPYLVEADPAVTAAAAIAVSSLTHPHELTVEACVLWTSGVRRAVLDATFDGVREGLDLLPAAHRDLWAGLLDEAELRDPWTFNPNGFVVPALQAAWSAICRTPIMVGDEPPNSHLRRATENAVRAGNDTDTIAAIAGTLLGARWGASAIPATWRDAVHGWPQLNATHLEELALRAAGFTW